MKDELKSALGRYRRNKYVEEHADETIARLLLIADRGTLANAYLAEHDDTPITKSVLRELGFDHPNPCATACYDLPINGAALRWRSPDPHELLICTQRSEIVLLRNPTCGEVRQLVRLLKGE